MAIEEVRITQDGHTLTRFVLRPDGEWREAPQTSEQWREHDADPAAAGGNSVRDRSRVPTFYGVGLVDIPGGKPLEICTQDWQFGDGPTTFAQPIHGRRWSDGRTVRVVYRFPNGTPIGHDKLTAVLDVLARNGLGEISLDALRNRLRNTPHPPR